MNDPPSRALDLLRTFEMIARQSRFAAAAQALHKTQSAVTQQMQRLQAQTGWFMPRADKVHVIMSAQGKPARGQAV